MPKVKEQKFPILAFCLEKPYLNENMPQLLEEMEYLENLRNFTVTLVGRVVIGYQAVPIENYTVSHNVPKLTIIAILTFVL